MGSEKWQFLLVYSTIYEYIDGWVGGWMGPTKGQKHADMIYGWSPSLMSSETITITSMFSLGKNEHFFKMMIDFFLHFL